MFAEYTDNVRPLVSIVMPAFNARRYIAQAIQSIIDQTYGNWELLICDDGSTDDTYDIICQFAENDSRVVVFKNDTNQKLLKTRNRLLHLAHGELITFQDADDYSDKSRLELMVREFQLNSRLGLLCSQVGYVNSRGDILRISRRPTTYEETLRTIYESNVVGGSMMMIRKESLEAVGGRFRSYFDGLSYQDYDLSFLVAEKYESYNLSQVLYYYRQHQKSSSKKISVTRLVAKEVVIHLAMQRKLHGKDDLQSGHPEKVDLFFEVLKKPFCQDLSLVYRKYAAEYMYNRLFKGSIFASIGAIRADPFRIVNYRTLLYCVRKSFTNQFVYVWNSWRSIVYRRPFYR